MKKNLVKICILAICILGLVSTPRSFMAAVDMVEIDCDGGTFREAAWANIYNITYALDAGESLSDRKHVLEDPTDIGRDFIGWNIYKKSDGSLVESKLTTQQVKDYKVQYPILVKAQYNDRPGTPVKGITYAAVNNDTGEPVMDAKITLIHDGVSYSGYGYVCIPEEIYSKWTKTITHIIEAPGYYTQMNRKWCDCTREEATMSPKDFKRHKSSYNTLSSTGKGKEIEHPRSKINDIFYEASFVKPNVSKPEEVAANTMISNTTVIPANATIEKEVYGSGKAYDTALATAQSKLNTSNILVVDLELKDATGTAIHQLGQAVQVRLDIPTNYVIQSGNTVVVYYLEDDGSLTECATTYHEENGSRYVLFETNHFSPYVIVEVPQKTEKPEDTQQDVTTEDTETTESTEEVVNTEDTDNTETIGNTENSGNQSDKDNPGSILPIIIVVVVVIIAAAVAFVVFKKKER